MTDDQYKQANTLKAIILNISNLIVEMRDTREFTRLPEEYKKEIVNAIQAVELKAQAAFKAL